MKKQKFRDSKKHPSHFNSKTSHPNKNQDKQKLIQGILVKKKGFGFVIPDNKNQQDLYVRGASLRLALNGDHVQARIKNLSKKNGKTEGEIVNVIFRKRKTIVGIIKKIGGHFLLQESSHGEIIKLDSSYKKPLHDGHFAAVKISKEPTLQEPAHGKVTRLMGSYENAKVDFTMLTEKYELSKEFPPPIETIAKKQGAEIPQEVLQKRRMLKNVPVFTIDGEDAKDFDDAVSIQNRKNGGWRLSVHIADVAHYVKENAPLDHEAFKRGTSVYLIDHVIPMLPFSLSNGLCSLVPGKWRLTITCEMDINRKGEVESTKIYESAIKSDRRFTYSEVGRILEKNLTKPVSDVLRKCLMDMNHLAKILKKNRNSRGSLDFEFPEISIHCRPDGSPDQINTRVRQDSHRMIEEFMILTNECVAQQLKKFPMIYRIHEKPKVLKLQEIKKTIQKLNISLSKGFQEGNPFAIQKVLNASQGKKYSETIQALILRSMNQAVYSEKNKGHFGLGSHFYTHFTSPIRRYPDLIVHRIIKDFLKNKLHRKNFHKQHLHLEKTAKHCSERERSAVDAEREYLDIKRTRFMRPFIGKYFDATISNISSFGIFVRLKKWPVEGMIPLNTVESDYFHFNEEELTLRGQRTGKLISIGQPLKVQLVASHLLKKQLDFQLVSFD